MVYPKFGGQTECIMGNWKIENGKFDIKKLKFCVWQITSMRLKTFCLLEFKYIADKFQTLHWY